MVNPMSLPALILGFLLASLYGAIFHLFLGGGLGRLLLFLILGWLGFLAGQILASSQGWTFDQVGALHLGTASVTSFMFLGIGHWLSLIEVERG
jgi:hypothetical protein